MLINIYYIWFIMTLNKVSASPWRTGHCGKAILKMSYGPSRHNPSQKQLIQIGTQAINSTYGEE